MAIVETWQEHFISNGLRLNDSVILLAFRSKPLDPEPPLESNPASAYPSTGLSRWRRRIASHAKDR
jgi:hypothetical protein